MIKDYDKPIYVILLFEDLKELKSKRTGENLGFPDLSGCQEMGFYYTFEEAKEDMNGNALDIRECCFNYGFILKHYPGVYNDSTFGGTHNDRWFFKWDDEKHGFYETEEPDIFKHVGL